MGKQKIPIIAFLMFIMILAFYSCNDNDDEGHDLNKSGVMHKPGLYNPESECTECHGDSLQGENPSFGDDTPSCYKCHDKKW